MAKAKPNQRQHAEELFFKGIALGRIAEYLDVHPSTLSEWASAGKWHERRTKLLTKRKSIEERLLNIIDKQLTYVDEATDIQIEAGEFTGVGKDVGLTLMRLFNGFKVQELTKIQVAALLDEFTDLVLKSDFALGKQLMEWAAQFVQSKFEDA